MGWAFVLLSGWLVYAQTEAVCRKDSRSALSKIGGCTLESPNGYYGCRLGSDDLYSCGCPIGLECSDFECGSVRIGECKCCSWWLWITIVFTIIAAVAVCAFFIFYFLHPIRPWTRAPKDPIERMESYARRGVPIGDAWRATQLVRPTGEPPIPFGPSKALGGVAARSVNGHPSEAVGMGPFSGRWSPGRAP